MKIISISFLIGERRMVVKADRRGLFPLPNPSSRHRPRKMKNYTAKQVIEHKYIRQSDPTLTLTNGEKVRVYQGGAPDSILTYPASIVDKHDDFYRSKSSFSRRMAYEQLEFPFEDYLWGDH